MDAALAPVDEDELELIRVMALRISHSTVETRELRNRVSLLEQRLAEAQARADTSDAQDILQQTQTRLEELEKERERLKGELQASASAAQEAKKANDVLAEESKAQNKALEKSIRRVQLENGILESDRDQIKTELRKSLAEKQQLRVGDNEEISKLKAELTQLQSDFSRVEKERNDYRSHLSESIDTVKRLCNEKTVVGQAADSVSRERNLLRNQLAAQTQKLADVEETYEQKLADARSEVLEKTKLLDSAVAASENLRQETETLREELTKARTEVIEKTAAANSAMAAMADHRREEEALRNDLTKARSEVVKSVRASNAVVAAMAQLRQGNETMYNELAEARKVKDRMNQLKMEYVIVMTERNVFIDRMAECNTMLKRLQEEKMAAEEAARKATKLESKCGQLSSQVEELSQEKANLTDELKDLRATIAKSAELMDNAASALTERLRNDLETLRQELAEAQEQERYWRETSNNNSASLECVREEKESLDVRVAYLQDDVNRKDVLIGDLQNQLNVGCQNIASLEQSVASLRAEVTAGLESSMSMQQTTDQAFQEVADLKQKLKERENEISKLRAADGTPGGTQSAPPRAFQFMPPTPQASSSQSSGESFTPRRSARKRGIKVEPCSDLEINLGDTCVYSMLSAYVSPVPKGRLQVFENLRGQAPLTDPRLAVPDFPSGMTHFTKTQLAKALGGNKQGLIVNIAADRRHIFTLSYELGITGYLCPKLDQNPWCPYAPGMDGYMFVGLGGDAVRLVEPEVRALFVNVVNQTSKKSSKLFFAGYYEVCKVEDVTLEEWTTVPDHIKRQYSETTRDKVKECFSKSITEIKAEYDGGTRRAPCRRLQFLGFRNPKDPDRDTYQALVSHLASLDAADETAPSSASVVSKKRKGEDQDGDSRQMRRKCIVRPRP